MPQEPQREYTLAELAAAAGLPARTLRYYIARGVLPPPLRAGRNAGYGAPHLVRLRQIRKWQAAGASLADIHRRLSGEHAAPNPPEVWWCYRLSEHIIVQVRADAPAEQKRAVNRWAAGWRRPAAGADEEE